MEARRSEQVRVWAPGRVNLIGEHTDYTGGFALPMAIQLGISLDAVRVDGRLRLGTDLVPDVLDVALPIAEPARVEPRWGRGPAAVAAELATPVGLDGRLTSTLPAASGLSSSAALQVAVALGLGATGSAREVAELCQRAEHRASGVPCGILDQLAIVSGVAGHATLVDCRAVTATPVVVPPDARFVVVHSGQERELAGSAYRARREQCEAAEAAVGPLRDAPLGAVDALDDPILRRRARHVVSENARVLAAVDALAAGDLASVGALMAESHRSLRDDFEVSTDHLDRLVDDLSSVPGVHGVRLTGAGFGGCVVALCDPGVDLPDGIVVEPSAGAAVR